MIRAYQNALRRGDRALGRPRRQVHGRRRARLLRLAAGARGRRRAGGPGRAGADRRRSAQLDTPGGRAARGPGRHRDRPGGGRRPDRRGRGAGADGGRRDAEPRGPAAGAGRAGQRRDRPGDAAAGRRPVRAGRPRPAARSRASPSRSRPGGSQGEGRAEGRFEALHGERLDAAGRARARARLLLERWERAKDGDGQVVLLVGRAGHRQVAAARGRCASGWAASRTRALSHFCSPYHTNSALIRSSPSSSGRRGFARDDAPEAQARQARGAARPGRATSWTRPCRCSPTLLGDPDRRPLPAAEPHARSGRRSGRSRRCSSSSPGLAARQPVLAVFEDVHWIDPTTLELLDLRGRARPAAAGAGAGHLPAGVPAALDRPRARHRAAAQPPRPAPGRGHGRRGSPATRRCRPRSSSRSSRAPTACRCSSRS